MTRKQQEEEAEIWKEMEEKNSNRTEEQVAKNLSWRIVGQKGERRLVLGPTRAPVTQETGGRGGTRGGTSGAARGRTMVRGAGRWSETYRQRLGSTVLVSVDYRYCIICTEKLGIFITGTRDSTDQGTQHPGTAFLFLCRLGSEIFKISEQMKKSHFYSLISRDRYTMKI
jgi:hypothetical protein